MKKKSSDRNPYAVLAKKRKAGAHKKKKKKRKEKTRELLDEAGDKS